MIVWEMSHAVEEVKEQQAGSELMRASDTRTDRYAGRTDSDGLMN